MQKLLLLYSILPLFAMNSGCHNAKYAASSTGAGGVLSQYRWNLEELNGQPVEQATLRQTAHLLFVPGESGSVSGNTGCNNFKGSFEISGTNSIKFQPFATTKMACPGNYIESKFLDAIRNSNSWSISNDQLMLNEGNTVVAKFGCTCRVCTVGRDSRDIERHLGTESYFRQTNCI